MMDPIKETKKDRCTAWLKQYLLANGPAKVSDVIKAGIEAGYSRALIFKAYQVLRPQIYNTDGYKSRNNCWVYRA